MKQLRILQGGIENGDKDWIEEAAASGDSSPSWVAPKDSQPGDEAVIYIGGYGFFATGIIDSDAKPRKGWTNRYGVTVHKLKLIQPAISLATIQRRIPKLTWANYPRSITTPDPAVVEQIRELLRDRRKTRLPDWDDEALAESNLDELRAAALMRSRPSAPPKVRKAIYRARSLAIKLYVLQRTEGYCEYCWELAPFIRTDGSPYLEPHHTTRLADEGPDHPAQVIAAPTVTAAPTTPPTERTSTKS